MNWIKDLKNKTWIDWIKIIVAIDIASAGIGLIINLHFHVLAGVLGFITRIFMGVMYIMVATLILKRVFPAVLHVDGDDHIEENNIDVDIKKGIKDGKRFTKNAIQKVEEFSDKIIDKIDHGLDKTEDFIKEKTKEAKKEMQNLIHKD